MTTKNMEFEFDLQQFALAQAQASLQAGGTNIIAINGSDTVTTSTATGTETVVIDSDTGTYGTTDTITSYAAVYNFAEGSSANIIGAGTDATVTPVYNVYDSDDKLISSDPGTATSSKAENTTITGSSSSPLWLAGGGETSQVTIQGVGSIADFSDGNNRIALERTANNALGLRGVVGEVVIAPTGAGTQFNQTLTANNNAAINATLSAAGVFDIQGTNGASPTISADQHVHLGRIDTIQTWLIGTNGIDLNKVSLGSNVSTENVTVTGAEGGYLAASIDNGGVLVNTVSGSGSVADTISVNGTVIGGAAKANASIFKFEDDLTVGVSKAGTIAVGESLEGGYANLALNADATISGGAIIAVDKLANNGNWVLGSSVTAAQLGNDTVTFTAAGSTITANSDGTKVGTLANYTSQVTVSAVDNHTLSAGGAAWTLDGAVNATTTGIFDSTGNVTLSGSELTVKGGTAGKTLAVGTNGDTLTMAANEVVAINSDSVISAVSTIEAGTSWLVRGGTNRAVTAGSESATSLGVAFASADSNSVFGALGKTTVSGSGNGIINTIESLSGNVTLSHGASNLAMDVMGTNWTVANEYNNSVIFDSTGSAASLGASSSDLAVTSASTDATLAITSMTGTISGAQTMSGVFNGVTVTAQDGDGVMGLQLESDTVTAGISAITSLNSGATINGDNAFNVNGVFDIYNANSSKTQFTLGANNSTITIQGVSSSDNYSVTSSNNQAVFYDIDSTQTGGSVQVTVNAAAVSISASSASKLNDAYIVSGTDGTDIVQIGGVKANDTINTSSNDKIFTVNFDTSNVTSDTTNPAVLAVNNARVSLTSANLTSGTSSLAMAVNDSGSTPYITIASGIAKDVTVTVGAGVYNIGNSAQVTISDLAGYLYVDEAGNVTGEDTMVAEARQQREQAINSLVGNVETPTIGAFYEFENIYFGNNTVFGGSPAWNHTVASYADATVSTRSSIASNSGVNIFGDDALNNYPNTVTLQSYLSNPINISHMEGYIEGQQTLNNAVIDVRNSNNSVVAVGVNTSDIVKTNHTIYGSARQSALLLGKTAAGNNVVIAGDGGNTISNEGGTASIFGGSGADTIYAMPTDHVEGGGGADFFYDSHGFEIYDYNFEDGDVIVATKLSSTATLNPANLSLNGNKIAIAGGETLTVGAADSYDEATATKAIIANANNATRNYLIWAGNYDTSLDASDFARGAIMISDINGGAVNTVVGSSYADTIYAGPNDIVYSGEGNDTINLASVESGSGQRGATVVLSSGKNDVFGWVGGFDNEEGANILQANAANVNFKTRSGTVVAAGDNASVNFGGLSADSTGAYNFLVGTEKVSFIASEATVTVNSNSEIADYYKAEKAGGLYVGSSVDAAFGITLGSDNFTSINHVNLQNESRASVIGSSASESITLVGSADAGAVKSVASGGGNDLIVSGGSGNDSSRSGNFLFFGEYNGYTYSSGRDIVRNFSFYRGSDQDADMSHADVLYLGDSRNYQGVSATASKLEISLGEDTKVSIEDNFSSSDNKIMRVRFGDTDEVFNCKFGVTTSNATNSFTYDGETNAFFGNTNRGRDTLNVASDLSNVNIWLGDRNFDQNYYYGINVLDGHNLADTKATLVGNSDSNVIYSGGSGTTSSLWGGGGQSNTLVGGEGLDTFFYFQQYKYTDSDGNQHSSNDTIVGAGADDLIWLYDVTLNDIDLETTANGISSNRVVVTLNDGSEITATNVSSEAHFRISDGNGGWTNVTAVTSGNNRHWE